MSSSSCRCSTPAARRSRPRLKSSASRSSSRARAGTRSGRAVSTPRRFRSTAYGKPGTSNISRRIHFQYLIFEPKDSTQAVTGAMNFVGGNFLQNSADLILDLVGPTGTEESTACRLASTGFPTPTLRARRRSPVREPPFPATRTSRRTTSPRRARWLLRPGRRRASVHRPPSTTGTWVWGEVTFKYVPDQHPVPGSLGSGTVIIVLKGLLNYSGAQSQADKNFN